MVRMISPLENRSSWEAEGPCRRNIFCLIGEKSMRELMKEERPSFPKRAVITAGMPYGNKKLHFGHIGGVFIHADVFARFLRDRIGSDNVIFVSGTDCYGSPILESHRRLKEETGTSISLEEYVLENHKKQKEALDRYQISLNLYAASALGRSGELHKEVSREVFEALYEKGYLDRLSTPQFYDPVHKVLLNGRQVVGQCPIQGCSSEKGYADECSQGHQYMPGELINPRSSVSGEIPEIVQVTNWYFRLEVFQKLLSERLAHLRSSSNERKYQLSAMEEFLKKPVIYVKKSQWEKMGQEVEKLPEHEYLEEANKSSVTLVFNHLEDRDIARMLLSEKGINYRTGKTLVPFRLTGNIEWGVPVPVKEGLEQLTFWVWPESLWAPISFTRAYLESRNKKAEEWKKWWCSGESKVYQFIGEDNIYFYGIAEMAMFMALQAKAPGIRPQEGDLTLPHLIANNHVLFMNKKASSSSAVKPPMARELLEYYTPEQLRMHFLSLGLDTDSASFMPKVYGNTGDGGQDTVLKEGNLLTNVFNRMVRSCFYTSQKYYTSKIPEGKVSEEVREEAKDAVLVYERHMYHHEFHRVTDLLDRYIRNMNKYWVNRIRVAETEENDILRSQVLIDTFHAVRTITSLLHPIAPAGCEMVREYLGIGEELWCWEHIFDSLDELVPDIGAHKLKFLEPRVDFFRKHECQLEM
jgi:methionyl-tRNA synthetase